MIGIMEGSVLSPTECGATGTELLEVAAARPKRQFLGCADCKKQAADYADATEHMLKAAALTVGRKRGQALDSLFRWLCRPVNDAKRLSRSNSVVSDVQPAAILRQVIDSHANTDINPSMDEISQISKDQQAPLASPKPVNLSSLSCDVTNGEEDEISTNGKGFVAHAAEAETGGVEGGEKEAEGGGSLEGGYGVHCRFHCDPCRLYHVVAHYYYDNPARAQEIQLVCRQLSMNIHFPAIFALLFNEWLFTDTDGTSHVTTKEFNVWLKGANRCFRYDLQHHSRHFAHLFDFTARLCVARNAGELAWEPDVDECRRPNHPSVLTAPMVEDLIHLIATLYLYYYDPRLLKHFSSVLACSQRCFEDQSEALPVAANQNEEIYDLFVCECIKLLRTVHGDVTFDVVVERVILCHLADLDPAMLSQRTCARLLAALHKFSSLRQTNREVRAAAQMALDRVFPEGRLTRGIIKFGLRACLYPRSFPVEAIKWSRDVVTSAVKQIGATSGPIFAITGSADGPTSFSGPLAAFPTELPIDINLSTLTPDVIGMLRQVVHMTYFGIQTARQTLTSPKSVAANSLSHVTNILKIAPTWIHRAESSARITEGKKVMEGDEKQLEVRGGGNGVNRMGLWYVLGAGVERVRALVRTPDLDDSWANGLE